MAAFLYWDQVLQQNWALGSVDDWVMACLWLQSWSNTDACLMKTVLNDECGMELDEPVVGDATCEGTV